MVELLEWIEPDGTAHPLDGSEGITVLAGRQGLFMPPIDIVDDDRPSGEGSIIYQVRRKTRDIDLPVIIQTESYDATMDLYGEAAAWFDPTRGDGRLRFTRTSGRQRELVARYRAGLEGSDDIRDMVETWARAVVTLSAVTLWQDVVETIVTVPMTDEASASFFPILPLHLTASVVVADLAVVNQGSGLAYPVWTITGPGTDIILQNITTGQQIVLGIALTASDALTIDTRLLEERPGLAIYDQNGVSRFAALDSSSTLWGLPGRTTSTVRVQMAGRDVASSISFRYSQRWLSP